MPVPAGAFYVFPDVSATGMDGGTFADRLLEEAGVCVLAGSGFGMMATESVRVSYVQTQARLQLAFERMDEFLAKG